MSCKYSCLGDISSRSSPTYHYQRSSSTSWSLKHGLCASCGQNIDQSDKALCHQSSHSLQNRGEENHPLLSLLPHLHWLPMVSPSSGLLLNPWLCFCRFSEANRMSCRGKHVNIWIAQMLRGSQKIFFHQMWSCLHASNPKVTTSVEDSHQSLLLSSSLPLSSQHPTLLQPCIATTLHPTVPCSCLQPLNPGQMYATDHMALSTSYCCQIWFGDPIKFCCHHCCH